MTKPQFSMSINLGHVLQIMSLVVAMVVGWMQLEARTSANAEKIERIEKEAAQERPRLRALEREVARSDERFSSILAYLTRIEARLEKMEQ